MSSVLLVLILDDVELGAGLARMATLSFRLGEVAVGRQWQSDAEKCYERAQRLAAKLSSIEDQRSAAWSLGILYDSIHHMRRDRDFKVTDLHGVAVAGTNAY